MDLSELNDAMAAWSAAKLAEKEASDKRREIEDYLIGALEIDAGKTGTINFPTGSGLLKVQPRLDTKVDSELLQEIAAENGLSDLLPTLFRWKAEVNATLFKSCDANARQILSRAITTKPGRPSFSFEVK